MVNVLNFRTLFSFFSQIKVGFWSGIHKFLVGVAKKEDPDQTASSEAVLSGTAFFA